MRQTTISNTDDIIDSRDIIARISELEEERDTLCSAVDVARETLGDLTDHDEVDAWREELQNAELALQEWNDSEEGQELKALLALQDEAKGEATL
jgi:hypothetical protein